MGAYAGANCVRVLGDRGSQKKEKKPKRKPLRRENRYYPTSQRTSFSFRLEPKTGEEIQENKEKQNPTKLVLWVGNESPDCLDNEQLACLVGTNPQLTIVSLPRHRFIDRLVELIQGCSSDYHLIAVMIEDNGFKRLLDKVTYPFLGEGLTCDFFVKIKGCLSRIYRLDGQQGCGWDLWINFDLESPREGIMLPRIRLDLTPPDLVAAWSLA